MIDKKIYQSLIGTECLDQPIQDDRRDRLKQLRAFCHAARLGSITRAAERVFSSQPSVSLQIRSLEKELGVGLFERNGPRIVLTAAGRVLYRRALPHGRESGSTPGHVHRAIPKCLREPFGSVQVKSPHPICFPRYLEAFQASAMPKSRSTRESVAAPRVWSWLRGYDDRHGHRRDGRRTARSRISPCWSRRPTY